MADEFDWGDPPEGESEASRSLVPKEPGDNPGFEVKKYGSVDQDTLESMLIGYLIYDEVVEQERPRLCDARNADRLVESGIAGVQFANGFLGDMFDELLGYYKAHRGMMSLEDGRQKALIAGGTNDQALMFADAMVRCHGALITRGINVDLLIERFRNHFLLKSAEQIYKTFQGERGSIGPTRALTNFRNSVRLKLGDPAAAPLKEFDLGKDLGNTLNWLLDMKRNPGKYKGPTCGIPAIDMRTTGFHKGQLTIFVGKHGGYKTTTLINVAHGLFSRGYNVLLASLEMEAALMEAKLLCRHSRDMFQARGLRWSKMYKGLISEPGDWARREVLARRVADETLPEEDRAEAEVQHRALVETLSGIERGQEEIAIAHKTWEDIDARPNRLRICNVGQSEKIKVSQLEKWIGDNSEEWLPDVVIVDYLALVDSDTSYENRRDLEVGDVCKRFRAMGALMGFHVISAAQYKRAAIERIRQYGLENPDKAQLQTDDIAESNQIGADADTIFFLWPGDGGNTLNLITPKARHMSDNPKGDTLQIDQDACTISEDIQSTSEIARTIPAAIGFESAQRLAVGDPLAPRIPDNDDDDFGTWLDGPSTKDAGDPVDPFEDLSGE